MTAILVTGNLSDGFQFIGPFVDHGAAANYSEKPSMEDSWIATLDRPERPAPPQGSVLKWRAEFLGFYDQYREHNGKTFTVLGVHDPRAYDSEEVGTMFVVRLSCGTVVVAWPEEIVDGWFVDGELPVGEPPMRPAGPKS